MKLIVILGIITVMATVAMTRHAKFGERSRGDRILFRSTTKLYPRIGKESYRYVTFRPPASKYVITAIFVEDNFRNNSGAIATTEAGGVGQSVAVIRLLSNKSRGIHSTISVFGKRAKN